MKAAAVESGSEQGLWLARDDGFPFLPRGAPANRQAEPDQPRNLHEIVPALGQLSLDECQLGIEDWRDLSQLRQLRLFECFHVLPPPGKLSDGVEAVAESLSAFPALRQLNLLGSGWIRLGSMPVLETLILDSADLPRVIAGDDLALQFPQLRTLVLRLRPGENVSEGEMGILRKLQQHPKLRRVELTTGVSGQRRFMNSQITVLQDQLPGLTVCRGEAGFKFADAFVMIAVIFGLLVSQVAISAALWALAAIPQAGTLPHFVRTIRGIAVGFAVLMLFSGFLSAWLMEIRWYFPVCLNLLAVSLSGILQQLPRSSSWKQQAVGIFSMVPGFFPQLIYFLPGTFVPLIVGDVAWFNAGLLLVSAVTFFVALSAMNWQRASLSELSEPGAGLPGAEARMRALERAYVDMKGTTIPSPRRLRGSFSERLRAGTSEFTRKQLTGLWIMMVPAFSTMFMVGKSLILPAVLGLTVFLFFFPILLRMLSWHQRRQRLSVDFLLPAGRDDFWRHFQVAVFWDLAIAIPVLFAAWVGQNMWQGTFSQHAAGLLLQLLLHAGAATLLYGLTVLGVVTPAKDGRRYLFGTIIGGLTMLMFQDMIANWCVPGTLSFSVWILSVFVVAAVAGVVLLVRLPGILRRLELP
ncbi:MAG: hypothetical protein ACKO2L_10595 [Planctomycetaceae bacterium]